MGGCASSEVILEKNDGDQAAYEARFKEDKVLGQGEFGVVKLVYEKKNGEEAPLKAYACKALRKGAVFKDNTLYAAIPPEVLSAEIDMLRTLNGEHYCMRLVAIYETPRNLLMVTDCYTGGEMMEYISKQKDDLRTEDISRVSYQLLSAVNHCAKNNIIHRDIKPENVMFETEAAGADLRLIDFGCSTNKVVADLHTTFAGTPFYNSPEMFQNKYSNKTDVWSVGVLLYVLVAGYPSDQLQMAFNKLLDTKRTTTKVLPNIPQDLPDSYYEMLDELLKYHHTKRKSGAEIMKMDFVVFHKDLEEGSDGDEGEDEVSEALVKPSPRRSRMMRTPSMALLGSVRRHSTFLDFKKFERSLTTCLATMLDANELDKLMSILKERFGEEKLQVVLVKQLKEIVKLEINNPACLSIIESMENSASYDNFAYHIELLEEFAPKDPAGRGKSAGAGTTTPAGANQNVKHPKRASVSEMTLRNKNIMTSSTGEDTFNIGISLHGKAPVTRSRGGGMSRAQSCAINV